MKNEINSKKVLFEMMNKVAGLPLNNTTDNKEYWIESSNGQGYFKDTKEEFYKAIDAGFSGFIKYENGKEFWVDSNKR